MKGMPKVGFIRDKTQIFSQFRNQNRRSQLSMQSNLLDDEQESFPGSYELTNPITLRSFIALEQIVLNLNDKNLEFSVHQTMNFFDENFPSSFNFTLCMNVFTAFSSLRGEFDTYLTYLKLIQAKEEETNKNHRYLWRIPI